jgi:hypothetical protein
MGRITLLVVMLACLLTPALAADIVPAPESPPPAPSQPPESKPEVAPSPRDPGMVKQPETIPHPGSVVTPPEVDPKMAINPEASPPHALEPSERPNQDQPPKKQ